MEMTFKTAEDYAGFTYEKLTYEAVSSAKLRGQSIVNLVDTDGNAVPSEAIDALSDEHIIVTSNTCRRHPAFLRTKKTTGSTDGFGCGRGREKRLRNISRNHGPFVYG